MLSPRILSQIAFGIAALLSFPSLAQADKPIALVSGDGYGRTEVKSIIENVLDRELPTVVYEDQGEFLPVEDFEKFRMVVLVGHHSERSYTAEESTRIQEFVENGGRLLLIHQAPKMLSVADGNRDADFLFGRSYYRRDNPLCSVNQPDAPLLAGAFENGPQPFWLRGNILLKSPEWENLIGMDDFILVGQRNIGEGKAYYVGSELFRMPTRIRTENGDPVEIEGWVRILKNILSEK